MLSKKSLLTAAVYSVSSWFIFSCQPGTLVTQQSPTVTVDSILFFEQKAIDDPFLDGLKPENDREIVLDTLLMPPPPPPPPDYREIDGFRIQVFAGLDSLNAYRIMNEIESKTEEPVYLVKENGLVKVQLGDFPYRVDADNRNMILRREGYNGAWVVGTKVRVARNDSARAMTDSSVTESEEIKEPANSDDAAYRIQILVTSDPVRARQVSQDLENQFSHAAWYEQVDNLFKVFIGKFSTREPAEALLEKVRENGYPDAWLVY